MRTALLFAGFSETMVEDLFISSGYISSKFRETSGLFMLK